MRSARSCPGGGCREVAKGPYPPTYLDGYACARGFNFDRGRLFFSHSFSPGFPTSAWKCAAQYSVVGVSVRMLQPLTAHFLPRYWLPTAGWILDTDFVAAVTGAAESVAVRLHGRGRLGSTG